MAAAQGDAYAQNSLGKVYAEGLGVPQDEQEALKCFLLAAKQGDADAQYNLGTRCTPTAKACSRTTRKRSNGLGWQQRKGLLPTVPQVHKVSADVACCHAKDRNSEFKKNVGENPAG